MDINSVDSLCIRILSKLKEQEEVRDEQISLFLKLSLKIIESSEVPELPRSFFLLKENVYKCWIYEKVDELDSNQAFIYGNLWGALKLIEVAEKNRENRKTMETLARKYESSRSVFQNMRDKPGIKHKELAERCKKTPSGLSQFLSSVKEEQLFYDIRLGREKYYYLEERGLILLDKIESQLKNKQRKLNWAYQCSNDWKIESEDINNGEYDEYLKFHYRRNLNQTKKDYIKKMQESFYDMMSGFDGKTLYENRTQDNSINISHYFTSYGLSEKVFEGKIRLEEVFNNDIDNIDVLTMYQMK